MTNYYAQHKEMATHRVEFAAYDGSILHHDCRAASSEDAVKQAEIEYEQELDILFVTTIH